MSTRFSLSRAVRLGTITAITSLASLGAVAAPQVTGAPAEPVETGRGPYAVACWQEGQKIFEERNVRDLLSIDLNEAPGASFHHADGTRRMILQFGETLCIVEYLGD